MSFIVRFFVKLTGIIPALIFYKPKYIKEKGKKSTKGLLVVSNHKSLLDYPLYIVTFWYKPIYTLIAEVLYSKNKLFSWFLNKLGGIKVDRDKKSVDFIEKSITLLDKGKTLLIFPEAQLPREGKMSELKPSWAYIALEAGVDILPVYTDGRYGIGKRTRVAMGAPVSVHELAGLKGGESKEEAISKANSALLNEFMRLKAVTEGK